MLIRRPLCEVVNWNIVFMLCNKSKVSVDLYVRSWIEMVVIPDSITLGTGRPLCEVVNWNFFVLYVNAYTTMSTSMWGRELKLSICRKRRTHFRRPLCEVVNWNSYAHHAAAPMSRKVDLYVRSWIEIYKELIEEKTILVDLYVRSWIEIKKERKKRKMKTVDLYVRSWIEICIWSIYDQKLVVDLYVRSWIEIMDGKDHVEMELGRPLCEVVNWNRSRSRWKWHWMKSTSTWGRELKYWIT